MEPTTQQLADLSALADGTLDPGRRAEVEASVAGSPELRALYDRERRAVEILHRARTSDRAPAGLRERIEADRQRASATRPRRRFGYGGAAAAALAAVVLALVLILASGSPGTPSLSQAAALAVRGPAFPAPRPDPQAPRARLNQDVQEVYFPNWSQSFGFHAVGQRIDRINGRTAMTVYYRRGARLVAYTIVGAPALATPAARVTWWNHVKLQTLTLNGRLVVTWQRANHTCILSTVGVPATTLQRLAAAG